MHEIITEIEIGAPAEHVWKTLTDFERYPEWNPFITRVAGEVREGARLEVRIAPPGGRAMTFRPRIMALYPRRQLRWIGRLGVPGIFDGEHVFRIESLGPDRVRFIHRECFRGLLVPFLRRSLDKGTVDGFQAMNRALKQRAEAVPALEAVPA